mmetsp:Transcript_156683/g.502922  ORF Transcript_156683/g.502922 Transcript_156683/m.502922 type:complete len:330 (-) Transcript_156683:435-1424(-)
MARAAQLALTAVVILKGFHAFSGSAFVAQGPTGPSVAGGRAAAAGGRDARLGAAAQLTAVGGVAASAAAALPSILGAAALLALAVSARGSKRSHQKGKSRVSVVCSAVAPNLSAAWATPAIAKNAHVPAPQSTRVASVAKLADLISLDDTEVIERSLPAVAATPLVASAVLPSAAPQPSAVPTTARPQAARFVGGCRRSSKGPRSTRFSSARAARRAVGSKLQPAACMAEPTVMSYDSSKLRSEIQTGMRINGFLNVGNSDDAKVQKSAISMTVMNGYRAVTIVNLGILYLDSSTTTPEIGIVSEAAQPRHLRLLSSSTFALVSSLACW